MNFKRQIISFALVLMPLFGVSAQSSSEALNFVRFAQDASRSGLAGAGMASSRSVAWASYDNPTAPLYSESSFNVGAGWQNWSASQSSFYNAGASWHVVDRLAISAGFTYGADEPYDVYSSTGRKNGTFTPTSMLLNLGIAYEVAPFFALGVNVHRASQTLAEKNSYSAFSADVLASGEFAGVKVAAGIESIGTKVKSAGGKEFSLPASAKLALGYEGCSLGILSYGAYLDADYFLNSKAVGVSAGLSVGYSDLACLRAGYHLGTEGCVIPSYASVGLGAAVKGIRLDFACLFGGQLSGTLVLNLGYSF